MVTLSISRRSGINDGMVLNNIGSDTLHGVYNRAGNLEKELEAIAERAPLALLSADQIRLYNAILAEARHLLPQSVVLREDAPDIEPGDIAHAQPFYRILHLAVVPTLHNALSVEPKVPLARV